jgi:hypothetical protein
MDENMNTMQARKVCSNDDDDDNAHNDPTAFDLSNNSNDITDTSVVLVTFPLTQVKLKIS